jgi:transposase
MSPLEARRKSLKRRKQLKCKAFNLKIDNKSIKENELYFKMLFLEAKWLYNHFLSQEDIFKINITDIKYVQVKVKDKFEEREIKYLPYNVKQTIYDKIKQDIINLAKTKNKGFKIGKLHFRNEVNTVSFKYFKIKNNKLCIPRKGKKKSDVQSTPLKIYGLNQIKGALEIGQVIFVKKPSGIYLRVTTYWPKENIQPRENLGIDFNISNTLVISNGQQIDKISIKESKRLKRLSRQQNKKTKGSKNRFKHNRLIAREHEKLSNRKEDIINKIVNKLKNYRIVIQNDSLQDWKQNRSYGTSIQHSILGGIKSRLISLETTKVINQFERTTNTCFNCGNRLYLKRSDRSFTCKECGFTHNRDLNAAKNIMKIGLEQSEFTPLESYIDFGPAKGIEVKTLKKENVLNET